MKIRRITRIRHEKTSYRFVDADTGAFYRNSLQPYTHAVLGRLDDDLVERPFSFHTTREAADLMVYKTDVALQGVTVVEIEVEPS